MRTVNTTSLILWPLLGAFGVLGFVVAVVLLMRATGSLVCGVLP